jgi:hypothetical protein
MSDDDVKLTKYILMCGGILETCGMESEKILRAADVREAVLTSRLLAPSLAYRVGLRQTANASIGPRVGVYHRHSADKYDQLGARCGYF